MGNRSREMAKTILNKEIEHEQDIEDWINDLGRRKDDFRKMRL